MSLSGSLPNGSVVYTSDQTKGKGQQGNVWISEPGKNLLLTIFLKKINLLPSRQFLLNAVTSLAVRETIVATIPNARCEIKWPNDIYLNDKKVAGILIESTISSSMIEQSAIGIGLNVNQQHFDLPTAISITQVADQVFEIDTMLEDLLLKLEEQLSRLQESEQRVIDEYLDHLRWKGESHTFRIGNEEQTGIIRGIDSAGKLLVEFSNEVKSFNFKEIVFLY